MITILFILTQMTSANEAKLPTYLQAAYGSNNPLTQALQNLGISAQMILPEPTHIGGNPTQDGYIRIADDNLRTNVRKTISKTPDIFTRILGKIRGNAKVPAMKKETRQGLILHLHALEQAAQTLAEEHRSPDLRALAFEVKFLSEVLQRKNNHPNAIDIGVVAPRVLYQTLARLSLQTEGGIPLYAALLQEGGKRSALAEIPVSESVEFFNKHLQGEIWPFVHGIGKEASEFRNAVKARFGEQAGKALVTHWQKPQVLKFGAENAPFQPQEVMSHRSFMHDTALKPLATPSPRFAWTRKNIALASGGGALVLGTGAYVIYQALHNKNEPRAAKKAK